MSLPHSTLKLVPLDLAKLGKVDELAIAQLDVGGTDDAGVDTEGAADLLVGLDAGIVAHDEVVAVGVTGLVFADGPRKVEHAPVRDVADHAALSEDELAGREDNSKQQQKKVSIGARKHSVYSGMRERRREGSDELLDLGDIDLVARKRTDLHTHTE